MNFLKSLILSASLLSQFAFADASKEVVFKGQTGESFDLEKTQMITKYRTEQRQSTCTRSIPYQEEECGYETRYKEECHWDPGNRSCRTEYERVCRTETTYERECRTETRYEQECTQGPSRQECRQGAPRQRCHNEPGREQCRTLPSGERRCRTIPGRRVCEKIPGERECRTVPGERSCRSVPRTDRVCENVPRYNEVCENVPRERCTGREGRNVCEDVPYQEYVCKMVTKYRTEEYACTKDIQVPYEVEQKVSSSVEVLFEASDAELKEFVLGFDLLEDGKVGVKALNDSAQNILIFKEQEIKVEEKEGDLVSQARFNFKFFNKESALKPVSQELKVTNVTPFWLSFISGKDGDFKSQTKLKISKDGKVLLDKVLEESDVTVSGQRYGNFVSVKIKELGVELESGDKPLVELEVKLLEVPSGSVLSEDKLVQKKEFKDLVVE